MRSKITIATVVVCLLTASASAQPVVYDAFDQFNLSSNSSTDLWSYRHEDPAKPAGPRAAEPALLPSVNAHYGGNWAPGPDVTGWNTSGRWPGILVNDTGADQTFFGILKIPADTVYTTGIDNARGGASVISFLAPTTGSYDIDFSMTHNHGGGGNGETFFIDHHSGAGLSSQTLLATGTTVTSGGLDIPAGTNPDGTVTANLTGVALTADDRVNFVVDTNGDGGADGVIFRSLTLTLVPEPSSIMLLALGAVACMLSGRRSRTMSR